MTQLPQKLGSPAERALAGAGITSLEDLTKFTEKEVSMLHGVGPNALGKLLTALKVRGLNFRKQ